MKIYFARHADAWVKPNVDYLIENNLIAVWYSGNKSLDPNDNCYSGKNNREKTCLNQMSLFNTDEESDTYIFVSYPPKNKGEPNRIYLGTPIKGSLQIVDTHKKDIYVKAIQYKLLSKVDLPVFPFVHLVAPRNHVLCEWTQCSLMATNYINSLIGEQDFKLVGEKAEEFVPSALEILCEEYLRERNTLKHKVFKTGGSLKHIDIYGLDHHSNLILGQVKNQSNQGELNGFSKVVQSFQDNQQSIKAYFFSASTKPEKSKIPENIEWVDINDVIKFFKADAKYATFIEKLVNLTW